MQLGNMQNEMQCREWVPERSFEWIRTHPALL